MFRFLIIISGLFFAVQAVYSAGAPVYAKTGPSVYVSTSASSTYISPLHANPNVVIIAMPQLYMPAQQQIRGYDSRKPCPKYPATNCPQQYRNVQAMNQIPQYPQNTKRSNQSGFSPKESSYSQTYFYYR